MWWREVNYWGAAVGRQAGWNGGGDQEAEGGGTSTIRPLSQQARCVLTLLCRVRLLATTVVLSSDLSLCYCCCVHFLSVISSLSSSLSLSACSLSFLLAHFFFSCLLWSPFLPCPHKLIPFLVLPHFQRTLPTLLLG